MHCTNCGSPVSQDAKFCGECGAKIDRTIRLTKPPPDVPAEVTAPKSSGWPIWTPLAAALLIMGVELWQLHGVSSGTIGEAIGVEIVAFGVGAALAAVGHLLSRSRFKISSLTSCVLIVFVLIEIGTHIPNRADYEQKVTSATESPPPPLTATQQAINQHAEQWYKVYPFLDIHGPNPNMAAIDGVVSRRDLLVAQGLNAVDALDQAVREIAPQYVQ